MKKDKFFEILFLNFPKTSEKSLFKHCCWFHTLKHSNTIIYDRLCFTLNKQLGYISVNKAYIAMRLHDFTHLPLRAVANLSEHSLSTVCFAFDG